MLVEFLRMRLGVMPLAYEVARELGAAQEQARRLVGMSCPAWCRFCGHYDQVRPALVAENGVPFPRSVKSHGGCRSGRTGRAG